MNRTEDKEKQDLSSKTMTLPEAASAVGIAHRTLLRYAAEGKLKGEKGYNRRMVPTVRDVEDLLDTLEREGRNVSANRTKLREKLHELGSKGDESNGTKVP